jgi:hypothetical protein
VGDVHQPLHVSFEDDRGGNNITVVGECQGKLHAAWDSCLVVKAVGADVGTACTLGPSRFRFMRPWRVRFSIAPRRFLVL